MPFKNPRQGIQACLVPFASHCTALSSQDTEKAARLDVEQSFVRPCVGDGEVQTPLHLLAQTSQVGSPRLARPSLLAPVRQDELT
jgi:hypothetical protein